MANPRKIKYYIPGALYDPEMIEAIAMVVHLKLLKPLELKRYLDGDKGDAYNIFCELIKANAPSFRANSAR